MLKVQHQETGGTVSAWLDCTREDLTTLNDVYDRPCDDTPARFYTLDEAKRYIDAMRGLIHTGGLDTPFRVLDADHPQAGMRAIVIFEAK